MDDIPVKKPKKYFYQRICRTKLYVFLKKNLLPFLLIMVFFITLLLNVWDIKKYELYDFEGTEVSTKVSNAVDSYLRDNIYGSNFFKLSPSKVEKDLYLSIPIVTSVEVEKSAPNKLVVFVDACEEKFLGYLKSGDCVLFSKGGVFIEEFCQEEGEECCSNYAKERNLIYFHSEEVSVSSLEDDKDRLLVLGEVANIVEVLEKFELEIDRVSLSNEVLELTDLEDRNYVFTISEDIKTQLQRVVAVLGSVNSSGIEYSSIDFRFERPVLSD